MTASEGKRADTGLRQAVEAAQLFRLPFGRQAWRGTQGSWLGVGLGSSIDFQDHRAYAPGDDPRYIHWAAYARTGQLTMKLYRAEVAPMVDLVIDTSASMAVEPAKAERTDQLVAFCLQSAAEVGAPVRVHATSGEDVCSVPLDWLKAGVWREKLAKRDAASALRAGISSRLPWRSSALKLLISDLLFPGEPARVLGPLASGAGLALVFAPTLAIERDLPVRGNIQLRDCETTATRLQRVDDDLANRYRVAYRRHFALWDEAARQRGVLLAGVDGAGALKQVLAGEPLRRGLVEHHV